MKTAMRYHLIHIRVARIKKIRNSVGEDVEKSEPSYTAGGRVKWGNHFGKQSGNSSNS